MKPIKIKYNGHTVGFIQDNTLYVKRNSFQICKKYNGIGVSELCFKYPFDRIKIIFDGETFTIDKNYFLKYSILDKLGHYEPQYFIPINKLTTDKLQMGLL